MSQLNQPPGGDKGHTWRPSDYELYISGHWKNWLTYRSYERFANTLVNLGLIATLAVIVFTLWDMFSDTWPNREYQVTLAILRLCCVPFILFELGVYFLRAPTSFAYIYRYSMDIIGISLMAIGCIYVCTHGNELWDICYDLQQKTCPEISRYTPTTQASLVHIAYTLPSLRLIRILSWPVDIYRKRFRPTYENTYIYLQSAFFVFCVSFAVISTTSVIIVDSESRCKPEAHESLQYELSSKENTTPQPQPVHFKSPRSSGFWLLLAFIAGEVENPVERPILSKVFLVVIIVLGGLVFAGTTASAPRFFSFLLDFLPAYRWRRTHLKDHLVICGYNQSIPNMIKDIYQVPGFKHKAFVFVNELGEPPYFKNLPLRVDQIYYVRGDFTQAEVLLKAGIKRARYAIVAADQHEQAHPRGDRDTRAVFAALNVEHLNSDIISVTERLNSRHKNILKTRSVEAVINRNQVSGRSLAMACQYPSLSHVLLDLVLYRDGISLCLYKIEEHQRSLSSEQLRTELGSKSIVPIGAIIQPPHNPNMRSTAIGTQFDKHLKTATHLVVVSWQDTTAPRIPAEGTNNYFRRVQDINLSSSVIILGWNDAATYLITEIAQARKNGEFFADEILIIVDDYSKVEPKKISRAIQEHLKKNKIMDLRFISRQNKHSQAQPAAGDFEPEDIRPINRSEYNTIYEAHYNSSQPDLQNTSLTIRCILRDFTDINNIETELDSAGRVIILADRGHNPNRDRDARTVFTALAIYHQHMSTEKIRPHIVVELIDEQHSELFKQTDIEVVLRNQMAGGALATACRHPRLLDVLTDLLTITGGHRLDFIHASKRQNANEGSSNFNHLALFYWSKGFILLGYESNAPINNGDKNYRRWYFFDPHLDVPQDATLIVVRKATGEAIT